MKSYLHWRRFEAKTLAAVNTVLALATLGDATHIVMIIIGKASKEGDNATRR